MSGYAGKLAKVEGSTYVMHTFAKQPRTTKLTEDELRVVSQLHVSIDVGCLD